MKKLIAIILILCSIMTVAAAETDLASMSFDDLLALQKAVVAEIMSRPEWKQVEVPGGSWTVGTDIPAGSYCITPTSKGGYITIYDNTGRMVISQGIRKDDSKIGKIELRDGYVVEVENGSLFFSPAIGLGF